MDLHVGIDIPSHQISRKNHRICFWGGESYATIKMEGFPLPMRFLFFEYSNIFDFPARVRFGGEMPTDNIMLLINNQS